jgi:putative NIF3 family GTP cyclohydrolase 1 type 2
MKQRTTYTASDVASVLETIAPKSLGNADDELGLVHGDPQQQVSALACLWQANVLSIQRVVDGGANMLICHEHLWLPKQESDWYPRVEQIWSNDQRRELLDRHGLTVYRSHSNWDALPGDGVPDQAVAALGIEGLGVVAAEKYFKVHRLPAPLRVAELVQRASKGLAYPAIRLFGDGSKTIRQFAFLIGGFGENQWNMPQVAKSLGAEALIIGEMSEFIVVAALEMGMPVIETLHSVSEMPAIRRQAQMLAERLPGLNVFFVPSGITGFEG